MIVIVIIFIWLYCSLSSAQIWIINIKKEKKKRIYIYNLGGNEMIFLFFYNLFVSAIKFSKKCVIFKKVFSIKLSHFSIFGNNLKWVKKNNLLTFLI